MITKGMSILLTLILVITTAAVFPREIKAAVDPDLLIITPSEFSEALMPLYEHKNATGMSTAMVSLESIYDQFEGDDEPAKIKNAIRFYYDSYDIRYVMLAGDCNKFPIRWQLGHFNDHVIDDDDATNDDKIYTAADFYYADLYDSTGSFNDWDANDNGYYGEIYRNDLNADGIDPTPEVAVARIPAADEAQLITCVDKIIAYELGVYDTGWFTRLLLIQKKWSEDIHAKESIASALSPLGFEATRLYEDIEPADYSGPVDGIPSWDTIHAALNSGCGFVSELYHGSPETWDYLYNTDNVSNLSNAPMLPVIYSGACETAKIYGKSIPYRSYHAVDGSIQAGVAIGSVGSTVFPVPDPIQTDNNTLSLGEAFLLSSENGAIAYYGCLETGETFLHKTLDEAFFTAYSLGYHVLGEMWEYAINTFAETYHLETLTEDDTWVPVCKMHTPSRFILLGDPSLRVGGINHTVQPPGTYWGALLSENAFGRDIVLTEDGYAVAGYAQAETGFDYWTLLARYDLDGNLLDSATFDDPVRNAAYSLIHDPGTGDLTMTGFKYNEVDLSGHIYGDEWVWLMSTDATLDRQSERVYGDPFPDRGNSIAADEDGYIIGGWHGRDMDGNGDGYLLRVTGDYSLDWEATADPVDDTTWWLVPEIFSVEITSDGGCILGTENGIVKASLGSAPVFQWRSGSGRYYAARQTADGGYIGVGRVDVDGPGGDNPCDMVITRFDGTGAVTWSTTYGRPSPVVGATGMRDSGYDVIESNGGYIVTGYTESYGYHGGPDLLVARYDESGVMEWDLVLGSAGFDEGRAIVAAPDGGYVVTGTNYSEGSNRLWAVKVPGGYTKPVAYFTITPSNPLFIETTVHFDASASYDPDGILVTYTWDFGDGTTGSGKTTSHRYHTPGTYNATLYVVDNEGLLGEYSEEIVVREMQIQWQNRYGNGHDYGYDIVSTPDGGYAIAGSCMNGSDIWSDLWAFKTDSLGNIVWEKTFPGPRTASARTVTRAQDGGYIVAGFRETTITNREIWILKLDESNGSKLWEKTYDYGLWGDEAYDIRWDSGGYILTGHASTGDAGHYDTLLLKLDLNGDHVWHEIYPAPGGESSLGYSVTPTTDGGYAITGGYGSNNDDGPLLTLKIAADRTETWRTNTGNTGDMSSGKWIFEPPESGYIVAGTLDGDFGLLKYTAGGGVDWSESWGWGTDWDLLNAAAVTADGGYLITGGIFDDLGNDDFYMIKTDSSGEKLWDWHISTKDPTEAGHGVIGLFDGSCVALYTEHPGNEGSTVLFKLGPNTAPVAAFDYSPINPSTGGPAHFDASASSDEEGGIARYLWDFGTGDTGTGVETDYTFPAPGTYDVKLTVVDSSGGAGSVTHSILVVSGCTVDFSADITSGTAPLNCLYSVSVTGGSPPFSYAWDMDDDGTTDSTEATPNHVYTVPGAYSVSLEVTDSLGASDTETKTDYITITGIYTMEPTVSVSTAEVSDSPGTDPAYTAGAPGDIDWSTARGFNLAATGTVDGDYPFRITFSTPVIPGFILYKLPGWTVTPYTIVDSYTIEVMLRIESGILDPPFVLAADITPPTMEPVNEAQGKYYTTAPVFLNFGFDDNLALDDGWYQIDSYSGAWTSIFTNATGTSWNGDGWVLPGFASLTDGSHTVYFLASDDSGNVEGESGEWSWQFFKGNAPGSVVPVPEPPPPAPGMTDLTGAITSQGRLIRSVTAVSSDSRVKMALAIGTTCQNSEGAPVYRIYIAALEEGDEVPDTPEGAIVVMPYYSMEPDMTRFSPPAVCTFEYGPGTLPENVDYDFLKVMYWDTASEQWKAVETIVNAANHRVSILQAHFSLYTVMLLPRPPEFEATELTVYPSEISVNDQALVKVKITNSGQQSGEYDVIFRLDGVTVETRTVTVAGGEFTWERFTLPTHAEGTHSIEINSLNATYTVNSATTGTAGPETTSENETESEDDTSPVPTLESIIPPEEGAKSSGNVEWWVYAVTGAVLLLIIAAWMQIRKTMSSEE